MPCGARPYAPTACRRSLVAVALFAAVVVARPASAQFTIAHSDPVRFPSPTALHFLQGFIDLPSTTVVVTPANRGKPWSLALRSLNPDLPPGKPLSDVQWRTLGSSAWKSLTTSYATVLVRDHGSETIVVEFRLILRWTDPPAYYQTEIAWRATH